MAKRVGREWKGPTVRAVPGLHDVAIGERRSPAGEYVQTVESIPGLRELMRPARRNLAWGRRLRVEEAANKIAMAKNSELALKISQIPEMEAVKFSPRQVRASLFLLKAMPEPEMKSLVQGIARELYTSTKPMREIAGEPLWPVVWLVNSIVRARLPEHAVRHIKASPQLQGIIFKQFDRKGVGISQELQNRYGLSDRTMLTLRQRWLAWNQGAPEIYRMELGRSPQSFARITWKLANYNFYGAGQRILLEAILEGEPIHISTLEKYKAEQEANIEIARREREWQKLEKEKAIPDLRKRVGFGEGFQKIMKLERVSPAAEPEKAGALRRQTSAILAELDWSTAAFPEIAERFGRTEEYIRLVNTAFNARAPQGVPNRMREYIMRLREQGLSAERIAPLLSARCSRAAGRKITMNYGTIRKVIKAEGKA